MNARQKQIIDECKSFGEDEVRHRLYSGAYESPSDRLLIEGWLHDIESTRNLSFQKKNMSIQNWILRLTIAILFLTAVSYCLRFCLISN
jgi:hypothetical protein